MGRPAAVYDPPDRKGTRTSSFQHDVTEGDFFFEYGVGYPMKIYRAERGRLVRLPFTRAESETVGAMVNTIASVAADNGQHHGVVFEFSRDGDIRQVGNVLGNGDTARVVWSPSRSKNQGASLDELLSSAERTVSNTGQWKGEFQGTKIWIGDASGSRAGQYEALLVTGGRGTELRARTFPALKRQILAALGARARNPKSRDDFRYVKRERPTLAVLERDPRIRWEQKYKVGEPGAVYEFNVKLPRMTASFRDEDLYVERVHAVRAFEKILRRDFPWVGELYFTGRSDGWLAIQDKQGKATATSILAIADRVDDALGEFVKYMEEEYPS